MGRMTRRIGAAVVAVGTMLAVVACVPTEPVPVGPALPSGGRVLTTGPADRDLWIEDANADLSAVAYVQRYQTGGDTAPNDGRYWIYDDHTGAVTLLPLRESRLDGPTGVSVSRDGRWVVFASPDPSLQVGPLARNCLRWDGPAVPPGSVYCAELYRFDLDTGQLTQLTGLAGSSDVNHMSPKLSADGLTVDYVAGPEDVRYEREERLDLQTGAVERLTPPTIQTWDRGTHDVVWERQYDRLTTVDHATGEVTTLAELYQSTLMFVSDDARYIVLRDRGFSYHLIDTDSGTDRKIPSPWINQDATRYVDVQHNISLTGQDRLINGPIKP